MAFRVWQRSSGFTPSMGFLCLEEGSADQGKLWNFTSGAWVAPSTNPTSSDVIQAMTLLDDYTPLASHYYYLDVTTLGGSPGRVLPIVFNGTTEAAQGEELHILSNARTDSLLAAQVVSGVSLQRWLRAIGAVLFGTVDPSTTGGATTHAFKYSATTLVTVVTDDAEDGKRDTVTIAS